MTDTAQAPTPRTDALFLECDAASDDEENWTSVIKFREHGRQLERELAQARADIEERDRRIDAYEDAHQYKETRACIAEAKLDALRERCERLEKALGEISEMSDAEVESLARYVANAALAQAGEVKPSPLPGHEFVYRWDYDRCADCGERHD